MKIVKRKVSKVRNFVFAKNQFHEKSQWQKFPHCESLTSREASGSLEKFCDGCYIWVPISNSKSSASWRFGYPLLSSEWNNKYRWKLSNEVRYTRNSTVWKFKNFSITNFSCEIKIDFGFYIQVGNLISRKISIT